MTQLTLVVRYPAPADAAQFDRDYAAHLDLAAVSRDVPDAVPVG